MDDETETTMDLDFFFGVLPYPAYRASGGASVRRVDPL